MKKKYTKSYILSNRGCHSREDVLEMDFMKNKDYSYQGIIESKSLSLPDKFWWLIQKTNLNNDKKLDIAIQCAETVLPIFEERCPNDDRPRKAIEAAKNKDADAAAADAAAADAADDAADDADDAAYAAADAAYAAACAAADDAADAAACAAAYAAAYDAAYEKRLMKILKSIK